MCDLLNRVQFLVFRPSAAAGSFYVETAVAYCWFEGNFSRSVSSARRIGEPFSDAQETFSFHIETEWAKQLQTSDQFSTRAY
ncbi:hypothetical protein DM992_40850 (plasmid) [Burkholderia sp. JP2-270]|nr:hypothetical protein DM992_40850 [Burkholderia sp. JP2-270]